MFAALAILALLVGCRSQKQKAEYEEKRKALVKEQQDKEAARLAVQGLLQKSCKSNKVLLPEDSTVISTCQDSARTLAADRSSVSFPFFGNQSVMLKGCGFEYYGSFEVKNAFGQTVKHTFKCFFDPKEQTAQATLTS